MISASNFRDAAPDKHSCPEEEEATFLPSCSSGPASEAHVPQGPILPPRRSALNSQRNVGDFLLPFPSLSLSSELKLASFQIHSLLFTFMFDRPSPKAAAEYLFGGEEEERPLRWADNRIH